MPKKINSSDIIELRKSGKSVPEIASILCISKSTALKYSSNIPLQRERINRSSEIEVKHKISESAKKWRRLNPEKSRQLVKLWKEGSCKAFTPHEKSLLPALELNFGKLRKEYVGKAWADFTNDEVIIEVTTDFGRGISSAIDRFADRLADKRRKIILCYSYGLGKIRRSRARKYKVEIINLKKFDGSWRN